MHGLPAELTTFIGRQTETTNPRDALAAHRLVTLSGARGAGKTRLAVHVAARAVGDYDDGVWFVDLAPVTNPDAVPVTAARVFGLPDQPGRSMTDTLLRFVRDRRLLMVLDNCEHVLDASATIVASLLGAAPGITLLARSREPLGVPGEAVWQVPSRSLADEAVELFADWFTAACSATTICPPVWRRLWPMRGCSQTRRYSTHGRASPGLWTRRRRPSRSPGRWTTRSCSLGP